MSEVLHRRKYARLVQGHESGPVLVGLLHYSPFVRGKAFGSVLVHDPTKTFIPLVEGFNGIHAGGANEVKRIILLYSGHHGDPVHIRNTLGPKGRGQGKGGFVEQQTPNGQIHQTSKVQTQSLHAAIGVSFTNLLFEAFPDTAFPSSAGIADLLNFKRCGVTTYDDRSPSPSVAAMLTNRPNSDRKFDRLVTTSQHEKTRDYFDRTADQYHVSQGAHAATSLVMIIHNSLLGESLQPRDIHPSIVSPQDNSSSSPQDTVEQSTDGRQSADGARRFTILSIRPACTEDG